MIDPHAFDQHHVETEWTVDSSDHSSDSYDASQLAQEGFHGDTAHSFEEFHHPNLDEWSTSHGSTFEYGYDTNSLPSLHDDGQAYGSPVSYDGSSHQSDWNDGGGWMPENSYDFSGNDHASSHFESNAFVDHHPVTFEGHSSSVGFSSWNDHGLNQQREGMSAESSAKHDEYLHKKAEAEKAAMDAQRNSKYYDEEAKKADLSDRAEKTAKAQEYSEERTKHLKDAEEWAKKAEDVEKYG